MAELYSYRPDGQKSGALNRLETSCSFYTEDPDGVPVEFLQLTHEAESSHK